MSWWIAAHHVSADGTARLATGKSAKPVLSLVVLILRLQ